MSMRAALNSGGFDVVELCYCVLELPRRRCCRGQRKSGSVKSVVPECSGANRCRSFGLWKSVMEFACDRTMSKRDAWPIRCADIIEYWIA